MSKSYIILEKQVGETPLQCLEKWRAANPAYTDIPLAYAGRLDPMASGKLLVLIGEECKRQTQYHALDKAYDVSVLLGVSSDSGDVLGLVEEAGATSVSQDRLRHTLNTLVGLVTLPYPIFSSKTVAGKPLHTWALEGRLAEIEVPTYTAHIHKLQLRSCDMKTRAELVELARQKIESLPPVTEASKALGKDFRRPQVRESWNVFANAGQPNDQFMMAHIRCISAAGVYMRTLAEVIAAELKTNGLAFAIHRTHIGHYKQLPLGLHFWNAP